MHVKQHDTYHLQQRQLPQLQQSVTAVMATTIVAVTVATLQTSCCWCDSLAEQICMLRVCTGLFYRLSLHAAVVFVPFLVLLSTGME